MDGTFEPEQFVDTAAVLALAAADVDGDSDVDIVLYADVLADFVRSVVVGADVNHHCLLRLADGEELVVPREGQGGDVDILQLGV